MSFAWDGRLTLFPVAASGKIAFQCQEITSSAESSGNGCASCSISRKASKATTSIRVRIITTPILRSRWDRYSCLGQQNHCYFSYSTDIFTIFISSIGLSVLFTLTFSILWMTSNPATALPKMVCFLSNQGVAVVVMNHWEPLWFGWPGLAIETVYGLVKTLSVMR